MSTNLFRDSLTERETRIQASRVLRDKSAPACPHGFTFITQCLKCTPPLEKGEAKLCDDLMEKLGWEALKFSQPFKAAQTLGIADRRWYPPEYNPRGHEPFWHEQKRVHEKTNKTTKKGQAEFEQLVTTRGEDYVRGGMKELTTYLREKGIADVGIR